VKLRALFLLAAAPLLAQETPVFRTETTLALVRFHVVSRQHYVDNIRPGDILLLEDGVPRKFTLFEGGQSAKRIVPVEMILLFDTSGSVMSANLLNPLAFKSTLLDGLDNVRLAVYGFSSALKRYCRPTRDFAGIRAALEALQQPHPRAETIPLQLPPKRKADPNGATWLYEAVIGAAQDASATRGAVTRMILAFSDGFPTTNSRPEDASSVCRELGIPVYPVVLGHERLLDQMKSVAESAYDKRGNTKPSASDRLARIEAKQDIIADYARLGELTGGRSFDPPAITLDIMRQILDGMVAQVRNEYVVGFTPEASAGPPRKHKLEVRLRARDIGRILGGARTLVH
jgi:VWFA-related protein